MIQNVADLREEPVVGETYYVLSYEDNSFVGGFAPVLGTVHEDRAYGFGSDRHIHVDLRFLAQRDFDRWAENAERQKCQPYDIIRLSAGTCDAFGQPQSRPMVCQRRVEAYRRASDSPTHVLDGHFNKAKLDMKRLRCPHHGTALGSMPCVEANGCRRAVVCPSHGLAWDRETGEMIPSAYLKYPSTVAGPEKGE